MASISTKLVKSSIISKITASAGSMFVILLAFMLSGIQVYAQSGSFVSGQIVDEESGKALVGASISIPELRIGGVTDKEGNFKFKAPAGKHTVEVKYIGYATVTRSVVVKEGQTTKLDLRLSQSSIKTNEIVVVGLSGEVDKNKLGNTISSVNNDDINNVVSSSAIDAISGRVVGAQVTRSSGQPGAGTYVTLRGRKTFEGSSQPLYIVDGIIIDNTALYDPSGTQSFSNRAVDINPEDIESMQILKGASAAALYGTKAGNGVIIITTKKGKFTSSEKPARITYSAWGQADFKSGEIPLQTKYGQRVPYTTGKPGSSDSYAMDDEGNPLPLPAGTKTYDHQDDVFRNTFSQEHSLTISGGVPQFDYSLNGTYLDNQGYVIGSELKRTSIRANVGVSLLPNLSLQSNTNYVNTDNDLPQDGSNTSGILLGSLRSPADFDNLDYLEADGTMRRFAGYDNPIWTQHNNTFNQKIGRIFHSTELKWMPLDWLTVSTRYGLDWYDYFYKERLAVGSATSAKIGSIDLSQITNFQNNFDLSFNINRSYYDGDLEFGLLAGSQSIWTNRQVVQAYSDQTLSFFDEIPAGSNKDSYSSFTQSEIQGLFGQLTTTYLNKYSLTLGIRRDGSSTFGNSEQFHYYPKAGISYNMSDETFWDGLRGVINNFRLRAAYGEAGSPDLPVAYATNNVYVTDGNFDPWTISSESKRGGFNGIRSSYIAGAEDIRPELTIERELGFDMGIMDNLLNLEFTYYYSNVNDIIMYLPAAPSTGYTNMLRNAAAMWNKGIELGITANLFNTPNFSWVTAVNYTTQDNEVTSLAADFYDLTGAFTGCINVAHVGDRLGVFHTYGWLRYDKAADDAAHEAGKTNDIDYVSDTEMAMYNYQDGDVRYSYWDAENGEVVGDDYGYDYVGAPRQDPDLIIKGDPNPDFMISWRNDFKIFKNFTASFLFDAVYGFDVWNGTRGALFNFGTAGATEDRADLWTDENATVEGSSSDGHTVYIGNPADGVIANKQEKYWTYYNGFLINEPHIEDGSFIKLREIRLDYRWDGLQEWNIGQIIFTFSARNLLTITKYDGYDPEVNTFSVAEGRGQDYFTLPQVQSYRFGITINY